MVSKKGESIHPPYMCRIIICIIAVMIVYTYSSLRNFLDTHGIRSWEWAHWHCGPHDPKCRITKLTAKITI